MMGLQVFIHSHRTVLLCAAMYAVCTVEAYKCAYVIRTAGRWHASVGRWLLTTDEVITVVPLWQSSSAAAAEWYRRATADGHSGAMPVLLLCYTRCTAADVTRCVYGQNAFITSCGRRVPPLDGQAVCAQFIIWALMLARADAKQIALTIWTDHENKIRLLNLNRSSRSGSMVSGDLGKFPDCAPWVMDRQTTVSSYFCSPFLVPHPWCPGQLPQSPTPRSTTEPMTQCRSDRCFDELGFHGEICNRPSAVWVDGLTHAQKLNAVVTCRDSFQNQYRKALKVLTLLQTLLLCPVAISVSAYVCLSARISRKPRPHFTKFSVHVNCGRGSVLRWRQSNTLYVFMVLCMTSFFSTEIGPME